MQNTKPFIYVGSDHGGFEDKKAVIDWLTDNGFEFEDMGAYTYDPADDYPEYAFATAHMVAKHPKSLGILLCKSGAGMVIAANKIKGIRAVDVQNQYDAVHAKEHNNANVMSLAGERLQKEDIISLVESFINTPFSGHERHVRRLKKIEDFENS